MDVFLPAPLLSQLVEDWEDYPDEQLVQVVGEAIEGAYSYFMWLMAVREHQCRLVVVQYRQQTPDGSGEEMYPHHQIGELYTLSGIHPEMAVAGAADLVEQSEDGITFALPLHDEVEAQIKAVADQFDLSEEDADVLVVAMLILQAEHDMYLEELDDQVFYLASRGLELQSDALLASDFGDWAIRLIGVIDEPGTTAMTEIYAEQPDEIKQPVPLFCQYVMDEGEEELDSSPAPSGKHLN